jgi:flagellar FliL protein
MPEEAPLSPEQSEETTPKKKGKKKLIFMMLLLILIAGGGGGGFYYWRHRAAQAAAVAKKDQATDKKAHDGAEQSEDGEVKEVIELQPFIVNLADKNEARYLRMTISLGIGESAEAKPDPLFTTKVRNSILAVITNKNSDDILTVEGKAQLRKEMLNAARSAVEKPEIHAIYITDFIVQL